MGPPTLYMVLWSWCCCGAHAEIFLREHEARLVYQRSKNTGMLPEDSDYADYTWNDIKLIQIDWDGQQTELEAA